MPARSAKTVLVTGATGRFGSLAEVLLDRGHQVRAMTRRPDSEAAQRLRDAGAEVVGGDFDDPSGIAAAAAGADVMFATGTAHRAGPEGELRHGLNVADAAATARVCYLVYISGDGAAADSPVPLFRVKWAIEERIRILELPATVLAPVYLMENLFNPWNEPALRASVYPSPIAVDRPLQQVALADVVSLAALAVERRDALVGRRVPIASEDLTGEDAAAALTAAIGRPFEAERVREGVLPAPLRAIFGWLESNGHSAKPQALRQEFPEVAWHTYEQWAAAQRERFRELCANRGLAPH